MSIRLLLKQAVHILRKDIRYLRVELCLTGVLLVVFAATHTRYPDYPAWALFGVAAAYLVGRLVHAEALAGDDQFWKTRPYSGAALAAAKLVFVVLFVSLPLFLVQLGLLVTEGFSPMDHLWGILWTGMLLLLAVVFPITALATLTRGAYGYAAAVLAAATLVMMVEANLGGPSAGWVARLDWTRHAVVIALVAPATLVILILQYGRRRNSLSRIVAVATAVIALTAASSMPVSLAMAMQRLFSPSTTLEPASVVLELDGAALGRRGRMLQDDAMAFDFPVRLSAAAPGLELDLYRLRATLETPAGDPVDSIVYTASRKGPEASASAVLRSRLPRTEFQEHADSPLRLRLSADFALWKQTETFQADAFEGRFRLGSLYCTIGIADPGQGLDLLTCRSPLRWPTGWIRTDHSGRLEAFQGSMGALADARLPDYSPFPGGLDMNAVGLQISGRDPAMRARPIRFVLSEPVAYLTKELETTIDLADYAVE